MQTASVNTPAIVSATSTTSAAAGKAAETDTASTPFGAVLSKEVAERGNAANAAPAAAGKPAKAQATPDGTEAGEQSDAAAATDDAAATVDPTQTQAATPADMLALMASMNGARNAPPAGKTAATDASATGELPGMAADARIATLQQAAAAHLQPGGLTQQSGKPDAASKHADQLTTAQRAGGRSAVDAKDDAEDQRAAAGKDLKSAPAEDLRAKAADAAKTAEDGFNKLAQKQTFGTEFKEAAASAQAAAVQPPTLVNAAQAANAAAHMADHIAPRVGTPGWDQAVAQKVTWMVAGDQQSASLTLNPPDLGPLQVVLNVTNSQADAAFTAAQPEVRQALEAAMPRLREILSDAGIQLGQATVSSGSPNQQGTPEQRQFQPAARSDDAAVDTQLRTTRVQSLSAGRGLVDTFA